MLIRRLRAALQDSAAAAGIKARIVPHQFRHYAGFRTIPGEVDFELIGGVLTNIFPA
jgi:site-specific recombinase XerD